MYNIHTTKDGTKMLIGEMDDQHLHNTIKVYLRRITEAKAVLDQPYLSDSLLSVFHQEVSPEALRAQATDAIKKLVAAIQPYLMEAYLRPDLVDVVSVGMQASFGRSGQMPKINVLSRLHPPLLEGDEDFAGVEGFYGEQEF